MSSGVSDRLKRQTTAGKHMEECDAIPWSQQVDEAYENLSSPTDNRSSGLSASIQFQNPPFIVRPETGASEKQKKAYLNDPKIKCYKPYYCTDSKRSEDSYSEKKINPPNVSYNIKKDHISQKMSSKESHKVAFGSTSVVRNEDHKTTNYSPVDNSSISSDLNLNKKKITWASVASQPAKPNKKNCNVLLKKKGPGMPPPPMIPGKHNLDINAWEFATNVPSSDVCGSIPISIPISESANPSEDDVSTNCGRPNIVEQQSSFSRKQTNFYCNKASKNVKGNSRALDVSRDRRYIQKNNEEQTQNSRQGNMNCISNYKETIDSECNERNTYENPNLFSDVEYSKSDTIDLSHIVLKKLRDRNNYNPAEIDMQKAALSRFFVIKSYSEDDIHRSIKYEIWCSTDHGNKRLDEAFKERVKQGGNVMLFFSVNGSGHFCGMAQMMTSVDYNSTSSVWSQDKWKGKFKVKWIYVKDVPNSQLRHIRLENNDNKSVTNSRDTQEVLSGKGLQVLRVLHLYKHQTSIFDDFYHYEKKQEEAVMKKPIQFDNYVHPSSSSNVCHSDVKEKEQNTDCFSGNFRDRITSPRGGHHNILGNRRYGKIIETQPSKVEIVKSTNYLNQDREDNESDTQSLQRYKNVCPENCSSSNPKRNINDIILHMNNFNCNENKIVGENTETNLS